MAIQPPISSATPTPQKDSGSGLNKSAGKYMKLGNKLNPVLSRLKSNPYEYNTLRFPMDIGDENYHDYVLININANSSVAPPQLGSGNETANAAAQQQKPVTPRQSQADNAKFRAGTIGKTSKSSGKSRNEITTQGEMSLSATQDNFSNPNRKRISTAILLPLPISAVAATYAADWQATNLGSAGGTLDRFNAAAAAMKADVSSIGNILSAGIGDKAQFAAIAGYSSIPEELKAGLEKNAGYALNPRTEVVYKGTPNRTFQFEFKLSPKSPIEAMHIERMIQTLKFAQAPSLTGEFGSWLKYPDDFDIGFYFNGKINPHVHRISSCAMTNITVDYSGGSGGMPIFKDGFPQSILLSMQFTELEMMTKERIKEGF